MATARDIIKSSLRLIGAISQGENPSASESSDGLTTLNDLLDSWSNENLIIPFRTTETFDLVSGQQVYTMGASGDFDTTWPIEIMKAYYQDNTASPKLELPIKLLTQAEWARIQTKETQSSIPTCGYVETEYPLKKIFLYPVPNIAKKIVIYSIKALVNFSDASDSLTLPPGYARALKYNLAIELAPEYGTEVTISVQNTAVTSKAALKSKNIRPVMMRSDAAILNMNKSFNWLTGE